MSAGLFMADRILYALRIALEELIFRKEMTEEEKLFLLAGRLPYLDLENGGDAIPENPVASWLPKSVWTRLCHLGTLPPFRGILQTFKEQSHAWKRYYKSARPEATALPGGLGVRLTTVEKALLLRALRPDVLKDPVAFELIKEGLGWTDVEHNLTSLESCAHRASANVPVLVLLQQGEGYSPASSLQTLIDEWPGPRRNAPRRLATAVIERGRKRAIYQKLEQAMKQGNWLLLENCHYDVETMQ